VVAAVVAELGQTMATAAEAVVIAEGMLLVVPVAVMPHPAAAVPAVAQLQKLALVIELLLAVEHLETASEATSQTYSAETKIGAYLTESVLVAEAPFVLAAMNVLLVGQLIHQALNYSRCSDY